MKSLSGAASLAVAFIGGCAPSEEPREKPPADEGSQIDPALLRYGQTVEIPTGMRAVRALTVGAKDRIYVGGDKSVRVFEANGQQCGEVPLDDEPTCLAVAMAEDGADERMYVGMRGQVEVLDRQGKRIGNAWKPPAEKTHFTSIAAVGDDVFVADFQNQIVWHYSASGKLQGRIGAADKARNIPGLRATTPFLDLAVGEDSLLYVVNPRLWRVETYTFVGDLERAWGKGSSDLEDFYGCCNPIHIAILPDKRFATAEKGMPRIKVYSPEGKFECVVAGPQQMASQAADLAADRRGRVLVLDGASAIVRVFERKRGQS